MSGDMDSYFKQCRKEKEPAKVEERSNQLYELEAHNEELQHLLDQADTTNNRLVLQLVDAHERINMLSDRLQDREIELSYSREQLQLQRIETCKI